jgi:hypothetical protein
VNRWGVWPSGGLGVRRRGFAGRAGLATAAVLGAVAMMSAPAVAGTTAPATAAVNINCPPPSLQIGQGLVPVPASKSGNPGC